MVAVPPEVTVLAGQSVHTVDAVPSAYVSAKQSVQGLGPSTFLNFPATHALQVLPSYPALHLQFDCDVLPGGLENAPAAPQNTHTVAAVELTYLPAMQSTHAVKPCTFAIFPAGQALQVPPAGPA